MRQVGHVTYMGKKWNAYRVLVGKLEGRSPLRRPRRRWEDTIETDLTEIVWVVFLSFRSDFLLYLLLLPKNLTTT
jgi:hypothetical protein